MRGLLRLSAGVDRLNTAMGRLAALLVLVAALISAGNAVSRYLFSASSNAWLDIQWYLFGAIVLLGGAETLRRNEHVRVDLIYGNLPARARLWIDAVGIVLFLLPLCLILTWLSAPIAWKTFVTSEGSSSAGGLILWPVRALMPLGFALLGLQGVSELIKRVAALRGDFTLDTAYHKPDQ